MVTQNMLHMCKGRQVAYDNNFIFGTTFDLTKCLEQLKLPNYQITPALLFMSYHIISVQCYKGHLNCGFFEHSSFVRLSSKYFSCSVLKPFVFV